MKFGPLDDDALRKQFSYLARIGIAPKFGSRPIGWYQQHQMCAIDVLAHKAGVSVPAMRDRDFEARVKNGIVQVRRPGKSWRDAGSPRALFDAADRCARR